MPRLYVSSAEFSSLAYPEAMAFAGQISRLSNVAGAIDKLLARASRRVDTFCKKRIVAVGTTTLSANVAQGATTLPVTSTLMFDNGHEEAVNLNPSGGTQEVVPIAPGGIQVTSWAPPYPGTITLAQGTQFAHNSGETVQGCFQEVSTVGSSSSSDVYSESLLQLNQAAQLAQAHAPQFSTSGLTRVIFLKQYPIISLLKLEHMLPIETTFNVVSTGPVGIHPSAGYLRLPLGSFVLPEGLFRSTYLAGFANVPDDVAQATVLYAADELQSMLSFGAYDISQGKRRAQYASSSEHLSRFVYDAEEILLAGNYKRLT